MGAREDTEELNGLMVQAVGALLGIRMPASGMTHCPFDGHEDGTPSFEIRKGGLRWNCYGCNERGGSIDLVKRLRGLSFLEAKRWLAEKSGLGTPRWRQSSCSVARPPSGLAVAHNPNPPDAVETPPDHAVYASFLARSPLRVSGQHYLRQRGISDTIVTRFAIGQTQNLTSIGELVAEFGFARVQAAGLLSKRSTENRYWPIFPADALLFPYLEAGHIAYFQARVLDEAVKESRWRNLNHRRRRLYNIDVLADASIKRVAICEGAMDVLSATQLGCEAVGLIGITAGLSDREVVALRGRQVDLLLDWDVPGERRAAMLRRELARFGVASTRKSAPRSGAKDVNDYLLEGNSRL